MPVISRVVRSSADASLAASVAVLLYLNTIRNGLVFDDHRAIERNPCVRPAAGWTSLADARYWHTLLTTDFWGTPLASANSHHSYRPLTVLSLRIDTELANSATASAAAPAASDAAAPRITHAVNAALHGLAAWLLWWHARVNLRGRSAPLLAALIFAAHPVNTEAVAYSVGRADLLAAVFGFAGMRLHALPSERGTRRLSFWAICWRRLAASACFLGALAAKETAIVLLAASVVSDALALLLSRRLARTEEACHQGECTEENAPLGKRTWLATQSLVCGCAHLIVLAAAFVWLRLCFVGPIAAAFRRLDNPIAFAPSRLSRVLSTAHVHVTNFGLLLWPATLSADYSFDAVPLIESIWHPAIARAACLYLGLALSGVLLLRRAMSARATRSQRRLAGASLSWLALLLLSYAPASHVLKPLSFVVAERLLYIPCAAASLLVAAALQSAVAPLAVHQPDAVGAPMATARADCANTQLGFDHVWRRRARRAFACFALVLGGARTMSRNLDWSDDESLFTAAAAAYPRSAKATYQLADGLVQRGNLSQAKLLLHKALSIEPGYHYAYLHLAKMALDRSELHDAAHYARASLAAVPSPNPHGHALAARALLGLARSAGSSASTSGNGAHGKGGRGKGGRGKGGGGKGGGGKGGGGKGEGGSQAGRGESDGKTSSPLMPELPSGSAALEASAEHSLSAIAADPHAPDVANHWSTLAEVRSTQQRWEDATHAFERATSLAPRDAAGVVNTGATLLKLGRPAEAARRFRHAIATLEALQRTSASEAIMHKARSGLEMAGSHRRRT